MTKPRSRIKKNRLRSPFLVEETSSTTIEKSKSQTELTQEVDLHSYCEVELPVSSSQKVDRLAEISARDDRPWQQSRQRCTGTVEPGLSPSVSMTEELESTSPYGQLFACKQNVVVPVQAPGNSAPQLQYTHKCQLTPSHPPH